MKTEIKKGTQLRNMKYGYIVTFICMVNALQFRTVDAFQFNLNEFEVINY